MFGVPAGAAILIVISILVYLGLAHRVLDRMRLTDRQALWILGLMAVGSFVNLPVIFRSVRVELNLGGAIIPVGIAFFLLITADSRWEVRRALIATAGTTLGLWALNQYAFQPDPWHGKMAWIDPVLAYPIVAGVVAFLLGRSRRSAFIAATISILWLDVLNLIWVLRSGLPGAVAIGGAGAFDSIVVAGVISVLLAETAGELRERLARRNLGGFAKPNKATAAVPLKKPITAAQSSSRRDGTPVKRR